MAGNSNSGDRPRLIKLRQEELRAKINGGTILKALQDHVDGKREMSRTQVSAAVALLNKIVPNVSESVVDVNARVEHVTDHKPDLSSILAELRSREAKRAGDDTVH